MKPNSERGLVFVNLERPLTIAAAQARIGIHFGAVVHKSFRAFFGDARISSVIVGARR